MLLALTRFRSFCSDQDIARLWALLAIVLLTGILEVAGIASILPFLQLAGNPDAAIENRWIKPLYNTLGFESSKAMLIAFGWLVIVFLTASNILYALASWHRQRIAWSIAHNVSLKLARSYAGLPYHFYLNRDSADIIKSVIDDVNNLVDGVVIAGCQFVSQLIIAGMILLLLIYINPVVAISALCVFAGIYLLIFFARKTYLTELGKERLLANSNRYITFVDLITGIKAIKSSNAQEYFINRFEKPSLKFSETQPKIHFSTMAPRYLVEAIGFGSVVGVVLFSAQSDVMFVNMLPTLTLFALAGYRLMPAANTVYMSIAHMLSSHQAINSIYADIHTENQADSIHPKKAKPAIAEPIAAQQISHFSQHITLQNLSFTYFDENSPVVDAINLTIPKRAKIAFVGPSGSGKTTLIDLLAGLLSPAAGQVLVDNTVITTDNADSWQRLIGYVPQDIFLYNDTIQNNITFGMEQKDIVRIKKVCKIAQISEYIEQELELGYDTTIGDHGVRLSGGQRQRLGLARALYRRPQVLILDEATSALDNLTENRVISAIYDEFPELTIISIAHRISTVKRCDKLYLIDHGKLIAEGTYTGLKSSSELFKELTCYD